MMKKNFTIGHFNKYISFFTESSDLCQLSCGAIIRPIMANSIYGYEQIEAMHLINRQFFCFTVRFDKNIKNYSLIKFEERSFRIIRVVNWNEDNRFMQVFAEEENV